MEKNMFSINENEYTQMTDEKLIENIKKMNEEDKREQEFLKMLDDIKNGISIEEFEIKYRNHK